MKKRIILLVLFLMTGVLFGCGKKESQADPTKHPDKQETQETTEPVTEEDVTTFDLALITGGWDSILDGGKYQQAWKSIAAYAEQEGISHRYYGAETEEKDDILSQVERALAAKAKTVIGIGEAMEEAVLEVAGDYPDVTFCVLDASGDAETDNVTFLSFDRMAAGFVAGYGAAAEGMKSCGIFSFGEALDNEYYYGFLQGMEKAGRYLTHEKTTVYTVSFGESGEKEAMQETLTEWLEEDGVELLVCCEGAKALCDEAAAPRTIPFIAPGTSQALQDFSSVAGVFVLNYEKAVKEYLEGMYGSGSYCLGMGQDMISYIRKDGAFAALTEEMEEALISFIETKEDYMNRNVKVPTAALGLEYVEFAY